MSYFINNLNQKIAYKSVKGGKLGIIYVHGLNSDMEGQKAIEMQKYAKKKRFFGSWIAEVYTLRQFFFRMSNYIK